MLLCMLGGGIGLAITVAIVWALVTAKKRATVRPDMAAAMTQTEAGTILIIKYTKL